MISRKSFLASVIMLLTTIALVGLVFARPEPAVVQTGLERLPLNLAGYHAIEDRFPEEVTRELNADISIYRHYRADAGTPLSLYVGYYGTAKGGRTGHNPYACLPGAGWAIVDTRTVMIPHSNQTTADKVNYVQARRDGLNTVMLHWYQTSGTKVLSTGVGQNIERIRGRLLRNRNDGAFVQLSMQVPDDQVTNAAAKLQQFAGNVLEQLPKYWPVER
ncbi:exosortase C-terminal domain/associated protein EpsI [Pelotalea chapellei]|uniref:EpsI family protein n=1 Tax=Pelotalea chapellei TaxID=44671 RepID=A0ABS5U590_9BACT|nr:exosortase C-terminal domain/associated protein EpsI [Pelotalea chapellei]MBT1070836.1 EpsI family protein [Pelotalea chapellei]